MARSLAVLMARSLAVLMARSLGELAAHRATRPIARRPVPSS
jgi:hypothetical protein